MKRERANRTKVGRLFVFEGPDGVGKTSLCRAATRYLVDSGHMADYLAFPGRELGSIGRVVYDLHHSQDVRGVSATALQALHVAAHVDAIERQIKPRIANGTHVLLDRYWWSTWVYGVCAAVDRSALRALIHFEDCVWKSVTPTAVILLRRPAPRQ